MAPVTEPAVSEPFGTLLTPITQRTAGERIAERIVTAIALGEFVPDQRLPTERELASMLEVSRTTVREALQRLQASGYVTTRRGRGGGTFVRADRGPDFDDMIARTLGPVWADLTELLDFRRLVEQLIARTAAQRRDERDIGRIRGRWRTTPSGRTAMSPGWPITRCTRPSRSATHNAPLAELSAQSPARGQPRLRCRALHARKCATARCTSIRRSPRRL